MKTRAKKKFSFMSTPEDLDGLRAIFGEMASNPGEGRQLARKMMRAIHRCRRRHGFRWVN
jgi:hypothetical protein